ncbi:MAG: hypothetical protein HZA95_02995 [Candidatus Vogelbacteria bacterium]|nr:hypothetical protein [Candidatus Vogelbacteria bacterium]
MQYTRFVEDNRSELGKMMKVALDLAHLLEHDALNITEEEKKSYMLSETVGEREKLFNAFCSVLAHAGLEMPPLERVLWESFLPKVAKEDFEKSLADKASNEVRAFQTKVLQLLRGKRGQAARASRAILEVLAMFPCWSDVSGLKKDTIEAKLMSLMVDGLGLDPIRPDYSKMSQPRSWDDGPSRTVRFVIFDDRKSDLMKTALALVGIPNVIIEPVQYKIGDAYRKSEGDSGQLELVSAANQILVREPQVIFMDEGLIKIEGFDLVPVLESMVEARGQKIICIPNSGGAAEKLIAACHGWDNFKKGEGRGVLEYIISAIDRMS